MKQAVFTIALLLAAGSAFAKGPKPIVIQAPGTTYTITIAWDASADAQTYTCYFDGQVAKDASGTPQVGLTALTCAYPVTVDGQQHTIGVTAVNPAFIPPESDPATLAVTLRRTGKPTNVKAK